MNGLDKLTRRAALSLAMALPFGALGAGMALAEDFYDGRTITVLVASSPGSGGDVSARTFVNGLASHLPGTPNIIVRNMEGAGGAVALNFTYERGDPDGLTFYYGNWDPMSVLAGGEGIRFIPEEFGVIGSAANERGPIVRTDSGDDFNTPADILSVEGLRVGGRASGNTNDLIGNLALTILGVDFRYIPGFKSMGKMSPGIMSGELQAGHTATGGFSRFFTNTTAEGETMMLFYHPFFDDSGEVLVPESTPFYDGLPSVAELYTQLYDAEPTGIEWDPYRWLRTIVHATSPAMIAPPGTPDELLVLMREAYQATWADPEFKTAWLKQFGQFPHVNSTDATIRAFQDYRSISSAQLAVVEQMIALGL
jgi:tripartite-type tricarboxylate transporter receptor subunit TctC